MDDPLTASVADLLRAATAAATGPESAAQLVELSDRLGGPLRVAIAGKIKAGKSTLLNALLGEELAPTDAGECTKIVTWYRRGDDPEVLPLPAVGRPGDRLLRQGSRRAGHRIGRPGAVGRRPAGGVLADQQADRDHPDRHPWYRLDQHRPVRQNAAGVDPGGRPTTRRRRRALPAAAHPCQRRAVSRVVPRRRSRRTAPR